MKHHNLFAPPALSAVAIPFLDQKMTDHPNAPSPERLATIDDDLEGMSRESLIAEARKLRAGIRTHRDSTGHELCWHHPALWGLLPDRTDPLPEVPPWPEFLRGCLRYRESLDLDSVKHFIRGGDDGRDDGKTQASARA